MKLKPLIFLITLFCSCSQWQYDKISGQKPVESKEEIDSVLSTLEKLTYSDLSDSYKERTGNIGVFKKMVEDSKNSYEEILDKTTKSLEKFIENAEIEKEKNIQ